jgi:hypothetical protein
MSRDCITMLYHTKMRLHVGIHPPASVVGPAQQTVCGKEMTRSVNCGKVQDCAILPMTAVALKAGCSCSATLGLRCTR